MGSVDSPYVLESTLETLIRVLESHERTRRPYFGGCSSLFNQPVTLSVFSGSGPSQSKHWNVRCPLPPGGSARINNSPQWGQVGRLARPITISFRLSENPSIPEEDQSPESTR